MEEYVLESNGICKYFGKAHAVEDVSIHIKKGSIYGLIGRNGAGKTTFMKIMCGLSSPTKGSYKLFGESGMGLGKVRYKVANLIEDPGILPTLSAFDNLKFKCYALGCYNKQYINDLLTLVGLGDTGKKKAQKFSLGMRQRLGIALALVGRPELLILDEPINGLDPQGIVEVRDVIKRLSSEKGLTILISSHILGELSKVATDYGIIDKGVLIKEMTAKELEEAQSDRLEIHVDNTEKASEVLKSMDITNFEIASPTTIVVAERIEDSALINKNLVMADVSVSEISLKGEDLEEYFLDVTGGANHA